MLPGRIATTLTKSHRCHGRDTGLTDRLDGTPLLPGPQYRQFQQRQVLDDFRPADTPVNLDEIVFFSHASRESTPALKGTEHLTLQLLHFHKGIAASPQRFEWLAQDQAHAVSPRITSAAFSGML